MKAHEAIKHMDVNGTPYVITGGRLRVMDLSQLPGGMRDSFDERGFFISEKADAADAAIERAREVAESADSQEKAARAEKEGAAFEAARAQTAAIREILPMGETEREMTLVGLLNPSGDTAVPAHLETHEPTPPVVAAVKEPDEDEVEEVEKGKATSLRGPLPDGFPGKTALEAAGHGTYAKVRKLQAQGKLTEVPGVGEATAEHIEEALKEGE